MNKPLFDKDELNKPVQTETKQPQSAKGGALPENQASLGAYGQNSATHLDLSLEHWKKSKLAWRDTVVGRGTIRLISRGVLGASFFAWGGQYATRAAGKGLEGYAFDGEINYKKPLHIIARTIDNIAAKPIRWAVTTLSGSEHAGERAIHFRPMTVQYSGTFKDKLKAGRSLGEEAIGITFDFFCASVGDALGRDLADMADKNVKKPWQDEHGHIKPVAAAKSAGKTLWRYISYNGGEDWAVAVPYAYFMRGQRHLINHFSPGFRLDATESNNGSGFKVDNHGRIKGNYNLAGAIDLQSRFTAYNIGTLMYREAYDWTANRLHGQKTNLYGAPDEERHSKKITDGVKNISKWIARSVVKGTIVMTPAVPFFWVTRVPQGKYKGTFINPETQSVLAFKSGMMHESDGKPKHTLLKPLHEIRNAEGRERFNPETNVVFRKFTGEINKESPHGWKTLKPIAKGNELNPWRDKMFDPHAWEHNTDWFSKILHPFGVANERLRQAARTTFKAHLDPKHISRFVNASVSYTPYMFMKAEGARAFDTGKMDLASERMIDGAFAGNAKEFKAGAHEVWRAILHKPFDDAQREAEAQRRIAIDTSAGDSALLSTSEEIQQIKEHTDKKAHKTATKGLDMAMSATDVALDIKDALSNGPEHASHSGGLSWQERTVQGRSAPVKRDMYSTAMAPANITRAEQEKMRKFLAESVPPSNSKH